MEIRGNWKKKDSYMCEAFYANLKVTTEQKIRAEKKNMKKKEEKKKKSQKTAKLK